MRGNDVAQLQMFLSKDPALYPEGMATSYYGLHTFAAVKRFQLRNNIQPLGIVGPKTRAKLNRLISL